MLKFQLFIIILNKKIYILNKIKKYIHINYSHKEIKLFIK